MSILLDKRSKILVQGITGREGSFHTEQMLNYPSKVVAGVTPKKGGTLFLNKIPIYNSVEEAVSETGANVSVIFVPPFACQDAIFEAISAKIKLIICITEGVSLHEMADVYSFLKTKKDVRLIGPNCPGVIVPGLCKAGIMPANAFMPGPVGIVSRSGTLTYEISHMLTTNGIGQSTVVGIGGDPIIGATFKDILMLFERDAQTEMVFLVGEIGGTDEEDACEFIREMTKPVVAFISGASAPEGKRMGHAGAIVYGKMGSVQSKIEAFRSAGVLVAESIDDLLSIAKRTLGVVKTSKGSKQHLFEYYITQIEGSDFSGRL
ncbi:succinate--CoA ligase subunit alpha [Thermodesulfobium sp.]